MSPTPAPAYPPADIATAVARGLHRANDPPRPEPDAARFARKYAAMSQNFRNGAWRHLDEDDLAQASNKSWGLVAETIKAVSAEYGGIIHKHQSIITVAQELARLPRHAGDADSALFISRTLMIARDLHSNFYEEELDADTVIAGLMQCEEFSALLFALFWPDGAP